MSFLAFILGREPHVSVAEIAAVIGNGAEWGKAELSKEAIILPVGSPSTGSGTTGYSLSERSESKGPPARELISRLGGTIKIGEVWRSVTRGNGMPHRMSRRSEATGVHPVWSMPEERMHEAIGRFMLDQTIADRKVHFGYSVYDLGGGTTRVREVRESLRRGAAAQKAWLTERERKVRWVTSREPTLSSVVVAKNDLLPDQNGVEVLVLVGADCIHLARTLAVQPFEEWSRRDYGRPSRDARSGMLPPKLARIMVNLALRQAQGITIVPERAKRVEGRSFTLLDPFCGSGTILTEAMALGVPRIIGTDVSAEAVEDAQTNIAWMQGRRSFSPSREGRREGEGSVCVQQCDVRRLSRCVRERVDAIVTEPYLGPSRQLPASSSTLAMELRTLYIDAFREFAKVLKPGGRVVFIVPVFRNDHSPIRTNRRMVKTGVHRVGEQETVLDITRDVGPFGFHRIEPFPHSLHDHPLLRGKENLPYARPDQRVGRRILVFARTRGSIT